MQVEKALVEVERLIAKSRRQSEGEEYWHALFDAEMKGFQQARLDMGEAARRGADPVQFMRDRLQSIDRLPNWSASQTLFEQSIAVRMGYKEAYDVMVMMRAEERAHPKTVARAVRSRSDLDLEL
jgi:hypothetical protein